MRLLVPVPFPKLIAAQLLALVEREPELVAAQVRAWLTEDDA